MGFRQYVEMTCEFCGCADFYSGKSMKEAKEYWKDIGGVFYKGLPFCEKACKEGYIKTQIQIQNGGIKTGLNDGPPNSIINYEKLYVKKGGS